MVYIDFDMYEDNLNTRLMCWSHCVVLLRYFFFWIFRAQRAAVNGLSSCLMAQILANPVVIVYRECLCKYPWNVRRVSVALQKIMSRELENGVNSLNIMLLKSVIINQV